MIPHKLMTLEVVSMMALIIMVPSLLATEQGTLTISGRVFDDSNGDGFKDADEPGLDGWDVVLKGPVVNSVVAKTDRKGYYIFTGLQSGSYELDVAAQENWTDTIPANGLRLLELVDTHEAKIDFGFKSNLAYQPSQVELNEINNNSFNENQITVDYAPYLGLWKNNDPNTRGITKVEMKKASPNEGILVHIWGKCHPNDCDWGDENATELSESLVVVHDSGFSKKNLTLSIEDNGYLRVVCHNHFADGSGRSDFTEEYYFSRESE